MHYSNAPGSNDQHRARIGRAVRHTKKWWLGIPIAVVTLWWTEALSWQGQAGPGPVAIALAETGGGYSRHGGGDAGENIWAQPNRGAVSGGTFDCSPVGRSSFIDYVCYHSDTRYLILRLANRD